MTTSTTLHGACHCGRLQLRFDTTLEPGGIRPRACDCSFCTKHGAAYISDPQGRLRLEVAEAAALHHYTQGSGLANFVLCQHCGVLMGVVFEHGEQVLGAVNARCLAEHAALGPAQTASPQTLSAAEKQQRWAALWTPTVQG
ncbi:GFA family protein [Ideonella paludis]|uniref:GFA family protein n=1 Tax=Ideonella paludis TaxID=1233411 RepID=UPI0036281108